jgi:type IV secretion system protein VirB9
MVFDDGRFTYFEFLGAREVPAIEAYNSDDQAVRVNWHMEPPFVVVERVARKFTLRIGNAVTGIFNEAYDAVGVSNGTATVSRAVRREVKEGQ